MSNKLRFSANLKWLFTELPFEERFQAAANAGFTAVEYASPYEFPIARLKALLDEHGLKQILFNTPVGKPGTVKASGQACHPDSVLAFRDDFARALDYAAGLECSMIHMQAGIRQAEVEVETASATFVENLRWAAEQALQRDIDIVLESINPHDIAGFLLQRQDQTLGLIQRSEAANVGLLFDIYHCQRSEGDVTAKMREFMPWIKHVQVAESPSRNEPGDGELNWPFLFNELRALQYSGWIGCEYRPKAGTEAGLGWLTRFN